jgi:EPS-associated MarR family transcriptional regulator
MKNNAYHNIDHFEVLRKIQRDSKSTQRRLAQELGFSLGKLNYCLKALKNKGLIKIHNLRKKDNKIKSLGYMITAKGIIHRTELTIRFMKRKMREYDELKLELQKIEGIKNGDFYK